MNSWSKRPSGVERRFPRHSLVLTVVGTAVGSTENLSEGGMFLQTSKRFAVGTQITATLSFPGLLESVEVSGVVTRRRAERTGLPAGIAGLPPGIGVEFRSPHHKGGPIIGRLVEEAGVPPSRAVAALTPFRLLVVEEDAAVAGLYRHVLEREKSTRGEGLFVTFAADGREAIHLLANAPYDLLITDLSLPNMRGHSLIEHVRSRPELAQMKIMVVSDSAPQELTHAKRLGADAVVAKPVRPRDLLETLRVLLRFREYSFAALS